MAKLNGVKTLDMVNGEITKIAYEGAEYAKVDDLVKSTEDILLAIENGLDRTKGEFYRVISVGSTVRWEDNTSVNGVGAEYIGDRFEVFRKISADKPTLEQRVESLESDVAALKGEKASETIEFEGATYRKVDREAIEGDVVVFKKGIHDSYINVGKAYKVTEDKLFIDEDGDSITVYSNEGDLNRTRETVDVYELQYVPQEGDIVVVTGNTNDSENKVGDIGKVTVVDYDDMDARVLVPNGKDYSNWTYFSEMRKATPAEVEKYEQAVKDAEKWAKIGRKPNEFKKGDIVRVIGNGRKGKYSPHTAKIGEVLVVERMGSQFPDHLGTTKGFILPEYAELVAPVESLFNA